MKTRKHPRHRHHFLWGDIFFLIAQPIVAAVTTTVFRVGFIESILLFYGLPSLYFSLRTPEKVKRSLIFAGIVSIIFGIFVDYLAHFNQIWFVQTIFPFRVLGQIPLEDFLWGFLYIYAIIIFYEHFLDKGKHILYDSHFKYLVLGTTSLISLIIISHYFMPSLLYIPYAYFIFGTSLFLIPSLIFLIFHPSLIAKYVKTAAYFFVLGLLHELTSLPLNHWSFHGTKFIGWVELLGTRFPFEEFIFFIVFGAIGILTYYELFDDDGK